MRNFVRRSVKGGRYNAFNQHCISATTDEVFNTNSKELNVNGKICDLLEKYFEFLNKYEKLYAKEFNSKYEENRDIDQKENIDYINKSLTQYLFIKSCQN